MQPLPAPGVDGLRFLGELTSLGLMSDEIARSQLVRSSPGHASTVTFGLSRRILKS
jgi:hypothetical protein